MFLSIAFKFKMLLIPLFLLSLFSVPFVDAQASAGNGSNTYLNPILDVGGADPSVLQLCLTFFLQTHVFTDGSFDMAIIIVSSFFKVLIEHLAQKPSDMTYSTNNDIPLLRSKVLTYDPFNKIPIPQI